MKTKAYIIIALATICCTAFLSSCQKDEKYDRVFRSYLLDEINKGNTIVWRFSDPTDTVYKEGTSEGTFRAGSAQLLQSEIDAVNKIYNDQAASQPLVDSTYYRFIRYKEQFHIDARNPYLSVFNEQIADAKDLLQRTVEGTDESQVLPGSKSTLQAVIDQALAYAALPYSSIIQSKLDSAALVLTLATSAFESNIKGAVYLQITNGSFELPGRDTIVTAIPGWNCKGPRWDWYAQYNTVYGTVTYDKSVDGKFCGALSNHYYPMWQKLKEVVHAGCTYTVNVPSAIWWSKDNWESKTFNTYVRVEILAFTKDTSVLASQDFNLGLSKTATDFKDCSLSVSIPAKTDLAGVRMGIRLLTYEDKYYGTLPSDEVLWADAIVFVDKVTIKRAKD